MPTVISVPLHRPEDGFGLQQALLEQVANGQRGPTALLWSSPRYVAAAHSETRLDGFSEAIRLAEEAGFPVLIRNSGGGAAAANEGSLSFSITAPVEDLRSGLYDRYEKLADLIIAALGKLGVTSEPGKIEGEFCPGAYSIRTRGRPCGEIKVAGLAQRVTRRAARVEALILVERTAEISRVLKDFYSALDRPFRPESIGNLSVSIEDMQDTLTAEVEERYGGEAEPVNIDLLNAARERSAGWRYEAQDDTQIPQP